MIGGLPLTALWGVFAIAGVIVLATGTRMTRIADQLADRTRFGEALIGGILLGAATSLSGSVVSLTAGIEGLASLAFSNGIGGIAAQTAFLALADLIYRRANLEHASAELTNVFQCGLLTVLMTLPVVAWTLPEVTILWVHPASLVLLVGYVIGMIATRRVSEQPMWRPVYTAETEPDTEEEDDPTSLSTPALFAFFCGLGVIMGLSGFVISQVGGSLIDRLGLSGAFVGSLLTATVTSLPELVTTIVAVRRGALQLAVGGIIGGNTFDMLFVTLADLGYTEGSLFHALGPGDFFWLAVGLLMTGILMLGLLMRERHGTARIGFESAMMLTIYLGAVVIQALAG